jgi:hypothetical protein
MQLLNQMFLQMNWVEQLQLKAAVNDILQTKWEPSITNICGSYGDQVSIEHQACAAIDIAKRDLPDLTEVKKYLESLDLICESHFNYSGAIAPDKDRDSHFHCVDKWFVEQYRSLKKSGNSKN